MGVHNSGIFEGLKVLDFAWVGVGPLTSKYLADNGATVLHVESTKRPDVLRVAPPFKDKIPGVNRSQFYADYNSSKLGLGIDLSNPKSRDLIAALVRWADVVTDAFTPHVLRSLQLDYEHLRAINPSIVMISTCMQGQTGPHAEYPGFGNLMAPICGFYDLTGYPDTGPMPPYGAYTDFICHRFTVSALIAALDHREKTGEGQYIDASQLEIALNFMGPLLLDYFANGRIATRQGNKSPWAAPHDNYPCKEENTWCAIAVETDAQWEALKQKMGYPEWAQQPQFATLAARKANEAELDRWMAAWTRNFTPKELTYLLQPEVPAGALWDVAELFEDDQIRFNEYFTPVEHKEVGVIPYTGVEFQIDDLPVGIRFAAPTIGQHTEEILRDILHMSEDEIADLLAEEVGEIT
ncbi:MAG: CoA transferase [Firmicutes bacterium]|nr:CoA transferase [Bacillota bacterium]